MATKLIQIKMDSSLKEKLQRVALSKGLNMTSYIKMTLIVASEEEEDSLITENGFSVAEEKRLIKSVQKGEEEYKNEKNGRFRTMKEALTDLDE